MCLKLFFFFRLIESPTSCPIIIPCQTLDSEKSFCHWRVAVVEDTERLGVLEISAIKVFDVRHHVRLVHFSC